MLFVCLFTRFRISNVVQWENEIFIETQFQQLYEVLRNTDIQILKNQEKYSIRWKEKTNFKQDTLHIHKTQHSQQTFLTYAVDVVMIPA